MRSYQRWVRAGIGVGATASILCLMELVALVAPSPASADTITPFSTVAGTSGLGVAVCPTATTCLALGANSAQQSLVVAFTDGVAQTPEVVTGPALADLACSSATACVAVGTDASGQNGVVVPIVDSVPQAPIAVSEAPLTGVACSDVHSCVAVGANASYTASFVVPIIDGVPHTPASVANAALGKVACSGAGFCVAVDAGADGNNASGSIVPISNGVPAAPQPVPSGSFYAGVACPNATTCEVVGGPALQGAVVQVNQTTGAGPEQDVPGTDSLTAIACPTATTCEAVGTGSQAFGVTVALTNGVPGVVQYVQDLAGSQVPPILRGVACPSAVTCVATGATPSDGNHGTYLPGTYGAIVTITGGVPGSAVYPSDGFYDVGGLACATPTTCEVVGDYATSPSPRVVSYAGYAGQVNVSPPEACADPVPTPASSGLADGQVLHGGQRLTSASGVYSLIMQGDGNLVEYLGSRVLFSTDTYGHRGAYAIMQTDGNLVVYQAGQPLFATGTYGNAGATLTLQNDGSAVVCNRGQGLYTNAATGDLLGSGMTLTANQELLSPDGKYNLVMQSDGNLVEYDAGGPVFSTSTYGHPGAVAIMQTDGNLVVYQAGQPLFSTGTFGRPGAVATLNNDGSFLVLQGGAQVYP